MEKTLNIDGKSVRFRANAGTVLRYRAWFGNDLIKDITELSEASAGGKSMTSEALVVALNIAYTMARQADPGVPDDPMDWIDGFDVFPIAEVVPELTRLWAESMHITVQEKNV